MPNKSPNLTNIMANLMRLMRNAPPAELLKAEQDLRDDVDIAPKYNQDFQAGLMAGTDEHGVPLPASGRGPQEAVAAYSELATQVQSLAGLYSTFAAKFDSRMGEMEKAVTVLMQKAGVKANIKKDDGEKGPDWESREAASDEDDEIEKAIAAVKGGTCTPQQAMLYLANPAKVENFTKVASPPDFSGPFRKAALPISDFESSLAHLTPEEHADAMALQSRLQAVGRIPGLTVEKACFGISSSVISKCFPHLA